MPIELNLHDIESSLSRLRNPGDSTFIAGIEVRRVQGGSLEYTIGGTANIGGDVAAATAIWGEIQQQQLRQSQQQPRPQTPSVSPNPVSTSTPVPPNPASNPPSPMPIAGGTGQQQSNPTPQPTTQSPTVNYLGVPIGAQSGQQPPQQNLSPEDFAAAMRALGGRAEAAEALRRAGIHPEEQSSPSRSRNLIGMLDELYRRQGAALRHLQGGGSLQDVLGAGLWGSAVRQRERTERAAAGSSSAERDAAANRMRAVEAQRDVISKEVETRDKNNREFERTGTLFNKLNTVTKEFGQSLSYSGSIGTSVFTALSQLSMGTAGAFATAGKIIGAMNEQYQQNMIQIMTGQANLNPLQAQEMQNRVIGRQMSQAQQAGAGQVVQAVVRRETAEDQAIREGAANRISSPEGSAWEWLRSRGFGLIAGAARFRETGSLTAAGIERQRVQENEERRYYERRIRGERDHTLATGVLSMFGLGAIAPMFSANATANAQRGTPRHYTPDTGPLPGVEAGVLGGPGAGSGALQWLSELQVNRLMTPESEAQNLQRIMEEAVRHLQNIDQNIGQENRNEGGWAGAAMAGGGF